MFSKAPPTAPPPPHASLFKLSGKIHTLKSGSLDHGNYKPNFNIAPWNNFSLIHFFSVNQRSFFHYDSLNKAVPLFKE